MSDDEDDEDYENSEKLWWTHIRSCKICNPPNKVTCQVGKKIVRQAWCNASEELLSEIEESYGSLIVDCRPGAE